MKQAIIVYNIVYANYPEWAEQVNAFIKAFRKVRIRLTPVLNIDAYDFVKRYKKSLNFIIFWDKDLYLGEQLEEFGIPIFNPIKAIRVCDDKALTLLKLKANKIATPKTVVMPYVHGDNILNHYDRVKILLGENGINYPFVLKQRHSSHNERAYVITNELMFKNILKALGGKELIIQEFIETSPGRNFKVHVAGKKAIAATTRVSQGNFRSDGSPIQVVATVPKLDRQIARLAAKAVLACGADFADVDILIDKKGNPLVTKVDSNAHTVVSEELSKVYITYFIAKHINKIYKHRKEDLLLIK